MHESDEHIAQELRYHLNQTPLEPTCPELSQKTKSKARKDEKAEEKEDDKILTEIYGESVKDVKSHN